MASLFGRGSLFVVTVPAGSANATIGNAFDWSVDGRARINAYTFTNLDATNYLAVSVNPMHVPDSLANVTVSNQTISGVLVGPGATQIFQIGSNYNGIFSITVWGQTANGTGASLLAIGGAISQR